MKKFSKKTTAVFGFNATISDHEMVFGTLDLDIF